MPSITKVNKRKRLAWARQLYRGKNTRFYRQGGAKMFWGCFTASGPGLLIPIEGMMNAVSYVAILREHVLPWIQQQEALKGVKLIFQQDNAPPHKALIARQFFRIVKLR